MSEWLQKARSGTDGTKNKIAIFGAVTVTVIIVIIWLLVIKQKNTDRVVKTESAREDLRPLFMIFKSAKDNFSNIKTDIRTQKAEVIEASTTDEAVVE